jgi:hypothetical protein
MVILACPARIQGHFVVMKKWRPQDAKKQFSQVVELAQTEGPQTVTKHG